MYINCLYELLKHFKMWFCRGGPYGDHEQEHEHDMEEHDPRGGGGGRRPRFYRRFYRPRRGGYYQQGDRGDQGDQGDRGDRGKPFRGRRRRPRREEGENGEVSNNADQVWEIEQLYIIIINTVFYRTNISVLSLSVLSFCGQSISRFAHDNSAKNLPNFTNFGVHICLDKV